jgi:hypothetical protein
VISAALERFKVQIPTRPYCSNDPRSSGVCFRRRDLALQCAYIQPNFPWLRRYLPFDVDREGAALLPERLDLPFPTIITVNLDTSHSHFLYELTFPVAQRNRKSDAFCRRVQKALALAYQADPGYIGLLTQNPLSPRWHHLVFDRVYTLAELAEALPAQFLESAGEWSKRSVAARNPLDVSSRNWDCFHYVRHFGYRLVDECSNQSDLFERVLRLCINRNAFCHDVLAFAERGEVHGNESRCRSVETELDEAYNFYPPREGDRLLTIAEYPNIGVTLERPAGLLDQFPRAILRRRDLCARAKKLFILISNLHLFPNGICFVPNALFAEILGCYDEDISRMLRQLRERHIIRTQPRFLKGRQTWSIQVPQEPSAWTADPKAITAPEI